MTRLPRPFVLAPLMLVAACTERTDYDPQPKPAAPAAASATTAAAVSTPSSASGLPALVRKPISFGAGSMSKVECLKVTGNSLVGDNCQSGFAVFGPYAAVAAGSDVTVSFTFKAAEQVAFSCEIVSDTGKVVHASLANQTVKKDQTMQVNLRTQPQLDTRTLEARVTVFTEKPVSYSLSDFSLVVQ